MTLKYIDVPLFDYPFYDFSIALEGNSYVLSFLYNERSQLYFMSIFDSNNSPIVQGVAVVPEYPITLDYAIPNLSGYFLLTRKATNISEPYKTYPDKLSEYYWMVYVYNEE